MDADLVAAMGLIARAVRSGRFSEALALMVEVFDGDMRGAVYALREVFNVDVAEQFPLIEPRHP